MFHAYKMFDTVTEQDFTAKMRLDANAPIVEIAAFENTIAVVQTGMEDLFITRERWSVLDLKNSAGALFAEQSSDMKVDLCDESPERKNR